jgi:hypothetical protein
MRRPPRQLRSAAALLRPTIQRTAQSPASASVRSLIAYNPCLTGYETTFTPLSGEWVSHTEPCRTPLDATSWPLYDEGNGVVELGKWCSRFRGSRASLDPAGKR